MTTNEEVVKMIPTSGVAFFPGMIFPIDVIEPEAVKAASLAEENGETVFIVSYNDDDMGDFDPENLYNVGCYAKIIQSIGRRQQKHVLVEVLSRGELLEVLQVRPYYEARTLPYESFNDHKRINDKYIKLIKEQYSKFLREEGRNEAEPENFDFIDDPNVLIDTIAGQLDLLGPRGQDLLAENDTTERLLYLIRLLKEENDVIRLENSIDEKVRLEFDRSQRENLLREQIRILQDELGEGSDDVIEKFSYRLESLNAPEEVQDKMNTEIGRLYRLPSGTSEGAVIENYIDWVLSLPWDKKDEVNHDPKKARKILEEDHYGLKKVKERILEYISVLKLTEQLRSPILCLVGAPGVGKTSIAKSIARATNRKFIRIALGGIRDEAEIRGHRRTYLGSIPGRIIYNLKMAGVNNPLILLDEIDKLGNDVRGDPASALLEVLDPEQNNTFTDNYIELPFDLSDVLFVTTANSASDIPEPLLDRMEVIEVDGYIQSEKLQIARRYLLKEVMAEHGLKKSQLHISDGAIRDIIDYYTKESGVRELKRKLARICRIAAKRIVEDDQKKISVTQSNLADFLGPQLYLFDKAEEKNRLGVVNGLAWTSVGGETLEVEVVKFPGKGKIKVTGQLGDVMQESVQAAFSFIRTQAKKLDLKDNFQEDIDLHIHVPEGAVPKDGPSAGVTIATALASALTGKPVSGSIAMTGEITLNGRILPIGGLREKLAAAHRARIKKVFIPMENKRDLEDIPDEIKKALEIVPVSDAGEILDAVFI